MPGFADEFLDLCPQTVVWTSLVSRDAYGKPTYGAAQTFSGRRIYRKSRSASQGQPEVLFTTEIIILDTPDVKYEDAIYISGDVAPFPPIASIERHVDESADQYVKVVMGRA
jgi:hypothetical protein